MPYRRVRRFRITVIQGITAAVLGSMALVGGLRWIDPPTSAFMLRHRLSMEKRPPIQYTWVDYDRIAPVMRMAVVAAEDQKFPLHFGFDFDAISDAVADHFTDRRSRGASTITQQTAKNLFLWSGRSLIRKGVEAYFSILMELFWPKQRILEVYLNIVEFGESIYGVSAAANHYFGKSASMLNAQEAALLSAVLPNPKKLRVAKPTPYLRARVRWILTQMAQLGGPNYLHLQPESK